jgi:hypothetical protein
MPLVAPTFCCKLPSPSLKRVFVLNLNHQHLIASSVYTDSVEYPMKLYVYLRFVEGMLSNTGTAAVVLLLLSRSSRLCDLPQLRHSRFQASLLPQPLPLDY